MKTPPANQPVLHASTKFGLSGKAVTRLLGFSLLLNFLFAAGIFYTGFYFRERLLQWYLSWRGDAPIVFFGDSITAQGQWNTLLGRRDIKNSGIPGLGVCHLREELDQQVLRFSPELCVVMGGINDVTILERTVQETIPDYRVILARLREAGIRTVVQLTLYERQSPATRIKVDSLNSWLLSYCDSLDIPVVNPNEWLADHTGLQKGFAGDRTHLTREAYEVWSEKLAPVINRELQAR